ncbi:ribosome maturation factor RimP [Sulfurimonas sp. HSL-3221]|uniref:ribosome maturation factor RimP n=1 Tax=Sulfurimonadaceae TaxID=2771471 RepID=UPI001E4D589F|nr:ribosome maturation factor RimP [Sulfurimonas sp. HSL-3221]UFS61924.1 ribosome maturation factor RimP [Sulfurimonas sp. HSL-3221]
MSLETDIKNLVESIGLHLYDTSVVTENGETIYRVNVIGEGGTTMDQCVEATKLISPMLDVTPPVQGEYRLEVSSPGVERKLKTLEHFRFSVGEKVELTLQDKTKLRGELKSVGEDGILSIETEAGTEAVPFDSVVKAATYFEW